MGATGIVLAAGAGTRAGGPKALRREPDGTPWLELAASALLDGGCERVVVVLGAGAGDARALVPRGITVVEAADWADGMSASLRAGLAASAGPVCITLVDLPGMPASVVSRMLAAGTLAQAVYDGRPGHPVLVPAEHVTPLSASLRGDAGARAYLTAHDATAVECGDLWHGEDRDH
jgi:CTP:molybdopterin cytidylyltransferase MocA